MYSGGSTSAYYIALRLQCRPYRTVPSINQLLSLHQFIKVWYSVGGSDLRVIEISLLVAGMAIKIEVLVVAGDIGKYIRVIVNTTYMSPVLQAILGMSLI